MILDQCRAIASAIWRVWPFLICVGGSYACRPAADPLAGHDELAQDTPGRAARFLWMQQRRRLVGGSELGLSGKQVIHERPSSRTRATSQGNAPEMGACLHPR